MTEQAVLEFDGPPTGPRVKCSKPGCNVKSPPGGFEKRRDGRQNGRCPGCRKLQAILGGRRSSAVAKVRGSDRGRVLSRDQKALRVVERFSGFRYKQWGSPAAKAWEERRGYTMHQLWTHRMKRLYARSLALGHETEGKSALPADEIPSILDARVRRRVA